MVPNTFKARLAVSMMLTLGSGGAAWAAQQQGAPTDKEQREQPRVIRNASNLKTTTATVEAVDKQKRTVTLKMEDGSMETVDVPKDVGTLENIKKGNKVNISYQESVAVAVYRKGEAKPETRSSEKMERTQGAQPGRTMQREQTVSAEIVSVDPKNNTVKLKGPKGKVREVAVEDPELRGKLKDLKPGEVVELTYTEAMAISLAPTEK